MFDLNTRSTKMPVMAGRLRTKCGGEAATHLPRSSRPLHELNGEAVEGECQSRDPAYFHNVASGVPCLRSSTPVPHRARDDRGWCVPAHLPCAAKRLPGAAHALKTHTRNSGTQCTGAPEPVAHESPSPAQFSGSSPTVIQPTQDFPANRAIARTTAARLTPH